MGDDEWSLGGGDRRRGQQESGENEDREAEIRIRHHCFEGEEWSWRSEENWDSISELGFTYIVISDHDSIILLPRLSLISSSRQMYSILIDKLPHA